MKLYLVIIALTLSSICDCNVLNERQEQEENAPKVIFIKQFEELLRLVQSQILRLSGQFTRLLSPRGSESPLPESDVLSEQLTNDLRELKKNAETLNDLMTQQFGGQESNGNIPRVPFLDQIREYIELMQKQFAGFARVVTKAISDNGSLYLADSVSGNGNKQSGSEGSGGRVPFLADFLEWIVLVQKQLNRYGESVRRALTGDTLLSLK